MNAHTRMLISSGILNNLITIKREVEQEIGENLFEYSVVNTDEIRDKFLDVLRNCISKEEIDMIIEEDLEMFQLFDIDLNVYGIKEINPCWKDEDYKEACSFILCDVLGRILANNDALLHEFVEELSKHYEDNDKLGLPF